MDDKKYASLTDDFRARIERERAQGGSGDAREMGAHFKGKDEDQSKIKSEDAASVASSDSSQDGGEVMGTLQNSVQFYFSSLQSFKGTASRVITNTEQSTESRVWFSTKR